MFPEREGMVSFSLPQSLHTHARSQQEDAWAETKSTLSVRHDLIAETRTPVAAMSVRERLSGTRYQGDWKDGSYWLLNFLKSKRTWSCYAWLCHSGEHHEGEKNFIFWPSTIQHSSCAAINVVLGKRFMEIVSISQTLFQFDQRSNVENYVLC